MEQTLNGVTIALVATVVGNIVTLLFAIYNSKSKKIEKNTEAIIELTTKIEFIFKAVEDMPKIRNDVNEAHRKLREVYSE